MLFYSYEIHKEVKFIETKTRKIIETKTRQKLELGEGRCGALFNRCKVSVREDEKFWRWTVVLGSIQFSCSVVSDSL